MIKLNLKTWQLVMRLSTEFNVQFAV